MNRIISYKGIRTIGLCLCIWLLPHTVLAQPDNDPPVQSPMQQQNIDTEEKTKTDLGLRISFGFSSLKSEQLQNSKAYFGYAIAMYHRINLNKQKTLALQYELAARFKGGNFANGDSGYSKISLFYVEMPVMLSVRVNKKKKNAARVLIGFQPGLLAKATLATGERSKTPVYFKLPLQRFDYAPVIATQFDLTKGMGIQLAFKYGLSNISTPEFNSANPDFQNPVLRPVIPNNTDIRNISFELGFVF